MLRINMLFQIEKITKRKRAQCIDLKTLELINKQNLV